MTMPTRPLRFIIPGSVYDDSFAENVAFTLRQMGHEVITRPRLSPRQYSSRLRTYYRFFQQKLNSQNYVPPEEKWLLNAAKTYRPDILLALTQSIREETLFELKRLGVNYRVAWWGDPPAHLKQMGLLSNEWDAIFFKDPEAVTKFWRIGLNTYLLHEAMNPDWHKPVATQQNDNVVVAGIFYGYRQFLVSRLIQDNISVGLYGPELPLWVKPEIKRYHKRQYIVKEEKSRVFGEGLACLNSTQIAEGNSLNCRAFEIAGAGGLQIMEYKPIIEQCFEPDKEILLFNTYGELLAQLERAKKYPQEMVTIRQAAARRALHEHTYRHRLTQMLNVIGAGKVGQAKFSTSVI